MDAYPGWREAGPGRALRRVGLRAGSLAALQLRTGGIADGIGDGLLAARPDLDPLAAAELAEERLPKLPAMGDLDLGDVLSSDYFFS